MATSCVHASVIWQLSQRKVRQVVFRCLKGVQSAENEFQIFCPNKQLLQSVKLLRYVNNHDSCSLSEQAYVNISSIGQFDDELSELVIPQYDGNYSSDSLCDNSFTVIDDNPCKNPQPIPVLITKRLPKPISAPRTSANRKVSTRKNLSSKL